MENLPVARWLVSGAVLLAAAFSVLPSCTLDRMGGASSSMGTGGAGGTPATCTAPEQCPGADTTCHWRTCEAGQCGSENAPQRTACDEGGGRLCDRGVCVECLEPADCGTGFACAAGHCVPQQCANGIQDPEEPDVDCGGEYCLPCANGEHCWTGSDCQSAVCSFGACVPCTTSDPCPDGTYCDAAGSGVCEPQKVNGESCAAAEQCASGHCPPQDGVCCDEACDGLCVACLGTKTGGASGLCAVVPNAADPDVECDVASVCDSLGTGCNGNASAPGCIPYPYGQSCGAGPSCSAGVQTNQDICDGNGACADGGTTPCSPHVCDGSLCGTDCASDAECVSTYWCDAVPDPDDCVADLAVGSACTRPQQCINNVNCWDSFCCNAVCSGACLNCNTTPGTCAGNACTCDEQYNSLPGYQLCGSTATECEFYVNTGGNQVSCNQLCGGLGGRCIDAWDNQSSACNHGADADCTTTSFSNNTKICRCSLGCSPNPRCPPGRTCQTDGSCP